jgi:hypothetical protein
LNAPARWKFSHLKKTRPPTRSSNVPEVKTGVLRATARIRSAALVTSSNPTVATPGLLVVKLVS